MALIDNIIAYYKFDESSGNAADSAGSLTLSNINTATFVAGLLNNCADLERSSSQYFTNADPASMDGLSQFSVSTWLNFESILDDMQPITKFGTTLATNQSWRLIVNTSQILLEIGTGAALGSVTANSTLSTATWYHVAFTWSGAASAGSRAKAYINGSDVTLSDGTPATMLAGTANFIVGNREGLPAGGYYDGKIDETGFWSRALSAAEVTQLYNGGTPLAYPFASNTGSGFFNLM